MTAGVFFLLLSAVIAFAVRIAYAGLALAVLVVYCITDDYVFGSVIATV